jgi:hypothetical protein
MRDAQPAFLFSHQGGGRVDCSPLGSAYSHGSSSLDPVLQDELVYVSHRPSEYQFRPQPQVGLY